MQNETSANANKIAKKELARRLRSADPGLEVVHPNAAGIDVGNESHYVAVRPDRDPNPYEGLRASQQISIAWQSGFAVAVSKRLPCNQRASIGFRCTTSRRSVDLCDQ